jgi:hypothetical protein
MTYLKEAKELENRWKRTGLLNGLEDRYVRSTTSVLLENQRKMNKSPRWKVQNRWKSKERRQKEEALGFKRISIPLVRRIYPSLIAEKLVGVQPLAEPSSLTYYMRFRYGRR